MEEGKRRRETRAFSFHITHIFHQSWFRALAKNRYCPTINNKYYAIVRFSIVDKRRKKMFIFFYASAPWWAVESFVIDIQCSTIWVTRCHQCVGVEKRLCTRFSWHSSGSNGSSSYAGSTCTKKYSWHRAHSHSSANASTCWHGATQHRGQLAASQLSAWIKLALVNVNTFAYIAVYRKDTGQRRRAHTHIHVYTR